MRRTGKNCSPDGETLKAEVVAVLEARRRLAVLRGRRALLLAMLEGEGTATADDVAEAVEMPADIDPRALGSVPGRLSYDRIIAPDGYVKSTRAKRHASPIQLWRLRDRQAAEQWLRDNPDLADPCNDQGAGSQSVLFDLQETATPAVRAGAAR